MRLDPRILTAPDPDAPRVRSGKIDSLSSSLAPNSVSDSDSFTQLPPATTSRPPSQQGSASSASEVHLPPALTDDVHLPQAVVADEELELARHHEAIVLPPLVFPDDKKKPKVQWEPTTLMQESSSLKKGGAPNSARLLSSPGNVMAMYQKKESPTEFHSSTPALVTAIDGDGRTDSGLGIMMSSPRFIRQKTFEPGVRRATVSADGVSHHALERLGVNADILKKEKGMKKLGICDLDIERSEELRRYTGIATKKMTRNKVELVFGFTGEQLQRDKAIKRLGTSEAEIFDDYCRRVSLLGTHEQPMTSF